MNPAGLGALGEDRNNLLPPTEALYQTYNAVGGVMEPVGYFNAIFTFDSRTTAASLGVFKGLTKDSLA